MNRKRVIMISLVRSIGLGNRPWSVGRGLALSLPLLLALAAVAYANGAASPGATYTGTNGGVAVTFTVSGDGTMVDSYSITGVIGHEPTGGTCQFVAHGAQGVWQGAPVNGRAFRYNLGAEILFRGEFTGPQTASGTFRLYYPPIGSTPACDTGWVAWTASTTAKPLGGSTAGGTAGGETTNGRSKTPTYLTWVSLKKVSANWLGGSVKAASGLCVNARTVYLMSGGKRVSKVRTNVHGTYRIPMGPQLRAARVRAAVPSRRTSRAICAAGSSKFLAARKTSRSHVLRREIRLILSNPTQT
jgi:hypothetical protein